jgi:hypothetical protein
LAAANSLAKTPNERGVQMAKDFLGDRKQALEESFFAKENARLLEKLKSEKDQIAERDALSEISGIISDEVLDKLCELGIESDTWAAVSIAPLVEVAWADGKIDPSEREAVLSAAVANGITSSSPSYLLLESWLQRRPDGRLLEVWGAFIIRLCSELEDHERGALKHQLIGRARSIAESAGGFLGLGSKVSAEEEVVLAELSKAFDG